MQDSAPYYQGECLDDLMRGVVEAVLTHGEHLSVRRGKCIELNGVLLQLDNPRARLSRTEMRGRLLSALGEFCWYMAGRDDLASIEYYIPPYKEEADGNVIQGAYGPRLVGPRDFNQIERIISLLKAYPTSRRAVIRLFDAMDIRTEQTNVPCTCILQFLIRRDQLHLITYMRSNDAYLGLPHDFFCFTMLQEWIACHLGVELGTYKHAVGSLHLYDRHLEMAKMFLGEGFQSTRLPMPVMPCASAETSLQKLLEAEESLRAPEVDIEKIDKLVGSVGTYWADLIRILQIFRISKEAPASNGQGADAIAKVRAEIVSETYYPFIDRFL